MNDFIQTKVCVECHLELPISEFHKDRKKENVRRSRCKFCTNLRVRRRYWSRKAVTS